MQEAKPVNLFILEDGNIGEMKSKLDEIER